MAIGKSNLALSLVGVMCLLAGCANMPARDTSNRGSTSTIIDTQKIVGCSQVHTLYTEQDAEKDVGGAWIGTEKATDQGSGICSYAMVRAKVRTAGEGAYDYLSYVTVEYPTVTKAKDYYLSKKEKRTGSVETTGIGDKAFVYNETKGTNYDTLIMLVGNHVVSIECKEVCTDELYKKIGTTISERLR